MLQRAELEGLADDLRRQAEALDVDQPLLVVMLMGGTGVGKSTLLNALAGGPIAQASFTRPTTRDPVVYFHHSVRPDRLDPALRLCRLAQHDRAGLQQKVIVDTPDLDTNDLANREKLHGAAAGRGHRALRRLAGEVPRPARLGAVQGAAAAAGVRVRAEQVGPLRRPARAACGPTRTCLRDLKAEGFANPLLFRTTAQAWLDAATAVRDVAAAETGRPARGRAVRAAAQLARTRA